MQFNTALCFLLLALASFITRKSKLIPIYYALSIIALVIALLTMLEYLFGYNFNIDQIITTKTLDLSLYPGRMSPNTAICFTILAMINIFLSFKTNVKLFKSLYLTANITVLTIALIGVLGYLFNASFYFSWGRITGMALHTCICFLLLSSPKIIFNGVHKKFDILGTILSALVFVTFFMAWLYTVDYDSSEIKQNIKKDITLLHANLERGIDIEYKAIDRFNNRLAQSSYSDLDAIKSDFKAYEDNFPSIYFMYYSNPKYKEPIFLSNYKISINKATQILDLCNSHETSNTEIICIQKQNKQFNVVFKPNFLDKTINKLNFKNYKIEVFFEGKKIFSNLDKGQQYGLSLSNSFSEENDWEIKVFLTSHNYEKLQRLFPAIFFMLGILIVFALQYKLT